MMAIYTAYIQYIHTFRGPSINQQKSVFASTGYGYQSCSWSAEDGKCFFQCTRSRLRTWSREKGAAVVPSRASSPILHTQAKSGTDERDFSHFPRLTASTKYNTVNLRVTLSFIVSRNCVPMRCSLPKVRRHRASNHQDSCGNERVLPFQVSPRTNFCSSLFSPT